MIVRPALVSDARRVAELHIDRIHDGFLATLGPAFLRRLYRRAVLSPRAFVLVAGDAERVVGFVAGVDDLKRFYRCFLLRDGLVAGTVAAPRLIRSLTRVLETQRYPATTDGLPKAEVLAVAVDERCAEQGIGRSLVAAATSTFRERGVPAAKVVAGTGNARALRLYEGCGFAANRTIAVHGRAESEVLVWPSS